LKAVKEVISIISIINNDKIAKEFLLRGLSRQNTQYDLILIDNKNSSYKSAAQAYNEASAKAKVSI
jgi:predicted O-methyltransferase YrrM